MEHKFYNMGVVGNPATHSLSPALHGYLLQERGMVGGYSILDTPPEGLPALLDYITQLRYCGVNITLPYKETFMNLCNHLHTSATEVGAVNVVKVVSTLDNLQGGFTEVAGSTASASASVSTPKSYSLIDDPTSTLQLVGYNTDITGFGLMLKYKGINPVGKDVLVLGAGGASRSVVRYLDKIGARVSIFNRTPINAKALAATLGVDVRVLSMDDVMDGSFHLTVNTTSVGVRGEGFDIFPKRIRSVHGVDLIYTSIATASRESIVKGRWIPTPFLTYMQLESSCDGLLHLIYQGIETFNILTDSEDRAIYSPEFIEVLYRNIIKMVARRVEKI